MLMIVGIKITARNTDWHLSFAFNSTARKNDSGIVMRSFPTAYTNVFRTDRQ